MENPAIIEGRIVFLGDNNEESSYLHNLLQGEGYILTSKTDITSFLNDINEKNFDLILINLETTRSMGFELIKKIKDNFLLRHIPIILMVEKLNTIEKIKGIYAGADDYIEKPLEAGELLTRVKASLWRAKRDLDANALTKLPGNASILRELNKRIKAKKSFCAAYVDLDKFKEYNDYFGFEKGDQLIRKTASIICEALNKFGTPHDFLGHIGGDDFFFITSPESIDTVCKKIISDFDDIIPSFYNDEAKKNGYITVKNRKGIRAEIPFMTITIGIATTTSRDIPHTGKIIQVATELKHYGKSFPHSIYLVDRRQNA